MAAKTVPPMLLSDTRASRAQMCKLITSCKAMSFVVAWAGSNHSVFEAISTHRAKIKRGVIGTHRCCTSPDALGAFEHFKPVRMRDPSGALFHPKLYLFEFSTRDVLVVGSHNLTMSAYTSNIEVGFALTMPKGSTTADEVRGLVESAWKKSDAITPDRVHSYKVLYDANRPSRTPRTLALPRLKAPSGTAGRLLSLPWSAYFAKLSGVIKHGLPERLRVLDEANRIATDIADHRRVGLDDMRLFAGTAGPKEDVDVDWGYFGRMSGFGVMKKLVHENRQAFVAALLRVPRRGEVRKEHYEAFTARFVAAFAGEARSGRIASASRLLALWRPDVFIPYNDGNRAGVAHGFGIRPGSVKLDTYWELVVLPTMSSEWWRSSRPTARLAGQAWDSRAALVDTLFYRE